jgi:hypothetical protein
MKRQHDRISFDHETSDEPIQSPNTAPRARTPDAVAREVSNDAPSDGRFQPARLALSQALIDTPTRDLQAAESANEPLRSSSSRFVPLNTPSAPASKSEHSQESDHPLLDDTQAAQQEPSQWSQRSTDDIAHDTSDAESSDERPHSLIPNADVPVSPSARSEESPVTPSDPGRAVEPVIPQHSTHDPSDASAMVEPSEESSQPATESSAAAAAPESSTHTPLRTVYYRRNQNNHLVNPRSTVVIYQWQPANSSMVEQRPPAALQHFLMIHPQLDHLTLYTRHLLRAAFLHSDNRPLLPVLPDRPLINVISYEDIPPGRNAPWPVRYGDPYDKLVGRDTMEAAIQREQLHGDRRAFLSMDNRMLLQTRQARHMAGLDTRPMDEEVVYRMKQTPNQWAVYGYGPSGQCQFQAWAIHCILFLDRWEREREIYKLDAVPLDATFLDAHFAMYHVPEDDGIAEELT